jgi:DNA-binding winged helix-turn-helix (wHTH) protein
MVGVGARPRGGEGPEGRRKQAVRYRFGDYFFDTERYELHRAGMLVPLRPKECDVLAYMSPAAPCLCLPLRV